MTQSRVNIRDMLAQAKISETRLAEWERVLESQGYRRAGDGPLSDTWIKDDEPRAPVSPAGKVTLFVDGFGVEIAEDYLTGTEIKDGDSVSHDTLDELSSRHQQRLAAAYGAGQIKQALIAGEYPPPDVLGDLTPTGRHRRPPEMRWPQAYATGPRKLAAITPEQARATMQTIMGADFAELERRIAARHADLVEQGYHPAGDGPLAGTYPKEDPDA